MTEHYKTRLGLEIQKEKDKNEGYFHCINVIRELQHSEGHILFF